MNVLVVDVHDLQSLKIIRSLSKDPAIRGFVLGSKKRAPVARSRHCHGYFSLQGAFEGEPWFERVCEVAKECNADLLMAVTEDTLRNLIHYRERFAQSGLKVMDMGSEESFQNSTDKWLFYEKLAQSGIPQPRTITLENSSTADDFWASVSSSGAVLKRRQGSGGADAQLIHHPDELAPYRKSSEKDRWILQEYVEGMDIAVNFVSRSGNFIAWFVQEAISTLGPFGHQVHMRIRTEHTAAVAMAQRVVAALEWEGPGCIDFRIDKRTSQLLCFENNPRFGRAVLIGTVAGVNLPLAAAGRPVSNNEAHEAEFQHLSNLYRSPRQLFSRWTRNGLRRRTILREIVRDPIPEMTQVISRFVSLVPLPGSNAARG